LLAVLGALPSYCLATCAQQDVGHCVARSAPDGTLVRFPRLRWETIANAARDRHGQGISIDYLRGGTTRATHHESALALGIPGGQVSGIFYPAPGSPPIVFARFAPGSNQLRIDVLRLDRTPDGRVTVADAIYGPHHGERFITQQAYLADQDVRAGRPGLNPLSAWKSAQDNVFHDICFQCPDGHGGIDSHTSGVATAVGIAMREVGAHLGIVAIAREWIDVQEQSSGGLLWSTVTIKVSGYARPDWWIASPMGTQIGGTTNLGICAVDGEQPCRREHIVSAGIQLAPWAGPNLPTDQDRLYYSENSQSGLTVLGYSLVTAALVGFGSYVWGGEALAGGGGAGLATSESTTLAAQGLTGSSAIGFGFAGGASYIGVSDLLHPGSTGDIQSTFLGTPLSSGKLSSSVPNNEIAAKLGALTTKLQTVSSIDNALSAEQLLFRGKCPSSKSRHSCASSSSTGVVPRTP
jgi:hypothetical protein